MWGKTMLKTIDKQSLKQRGEAKRANQDMESIEDALMQDEKDIYRLGCSGFSSFEDIRSSYCIFLRRRTSGQVICTFPRYVDSPETPHLHRPQLVCNCVPIANMEQCILVRYAHHRQSLQPWSEACPNLPIILDEHVVD